MEYDTVVMTKQALTPMSTRAERLRLNGKQGVNFHPTSWARPLFPPAPRLIVVSHEREGAAMPSLHEEQTDLTK